MYCEETFVFVVSPLYDTNISFFGQFKVLVSDHITPSGAENLGQLIWMDLWSYDMICPFDKRLVRLYNTSSPNFSTRRL